MRRNKLALAAIIGAILLASCFLPSARIYAVGMFWSNSYDGSLHDDDKAEAITADNAGNVYVTGTCQDSIKLWNDTFVTYDFTTIKYTPGGEIAWIGKYINNAPLHGGAFAKAIAVHQYTHDVYVTGSADNFSSSTSDFLTVKYLPNGDTAWTRRYNGPGNSDDCAVAIAVDNFGYVYVTGVSTGSQTSWDFATIKYLPNGDTAWVRRYNGSIDREDRPYAIAVDVLGNVYVTGFHSMTFGHGHGYCTIKYNANGVRQWVADYMGPSIYDDCAYAIAVDTNNFDVYVTGTSYSSSSGYDYATVKYNSNGIQQWVQRYNGTGNTVDVANSIVTDWSGNVFVTGWSEGFDSYSDYVTIKYNSAGVVQWIARYNGITNLGDYARCITKDAAGNIYVTGTSDNSFGGGDFLTIKYNNATGDTIWTMRHGSSEYDNEAVDIVVDNSMNVLVTGRTWPINSENQDFLTVKYVQEFPPLRRWGQVQSVPQSPSGKNIKDGGALVAVIDPRGVNYLFGLNGNKTNYCMGVRLNADTWSLPGAFESIPFTGKPTPEDTPTIKINKKYPGKGASMCFDGDSIIYVVKGNGTREFWAYNFNQNHWTLKSFVPVAKGLGSGSSLAFFDGKVYLLAGSQKAGEQNFFVYDPLTNHWTSSNQLPPGPNNKLWKAGSCLSVYNNKIYALKGGDKQNYFYRYDAPVWTSLESIPLLDTLTKTPTIKTKKVTIKDGGAMANGYGVLYAMKGGGATSLWKYTPTTGWTSSVNDTIPRPNKKSVPKAGASMTFCVGVIWILKGNNTNEVWVYVPPDDKERVVPVGQGFSLATQSRPKGLPYNQTTTISVTPNPFTKLSTIKYNVPISGKVSIKLYNSTGKLISTLLDESKPAGSYSLIIDNCKLKISKGVYFLRYEDKTNQKEIKLIIE